MRLDSGPASLDEAMTLGTYFCSLIDNPSWIRRRVETVHIVDTQRVERRVTLDIDVDRVRDFAAGAGLEVGPVKKLPVPLTLLTKTLLLDVDVRDQSGSSLAIATSHEDSRAAHAMILCRIQQELPLLTLTPLVVERLYSIAKEMPSKSDFDALANVGQSRPIAAWRLADGSQIPTELDREAWRQLFANERVLATIADFTRLFMPTIYLGAETGLAIVKYRYVEQEPIMPRMSWGERLGLSPSTTLIEAPAAGRAEREHLRLVAPNGVSIIDMVLGRIVQASPAPRPSQTFQRRVALERGVLYSSGLERGNYVAFADIVPNVSEFTLPALAATLLSSALLLGGAWYQHAVGPLQDAQSAIALLLLAPSTVAAFLTRRGEHQLLGRILAWPRLLVGMTTLWSLVAAVSIVLQQQTPRDGLISPISQSGVEATWWVAGTYCLLVSLLLAVVAVRGYWRVRQVEDGGFSWSAGVEDFHL